MFSPGPRTNGRRITLQEDTDNHPTDKKAGIME
jgi:hypothetical protein